MFAWKTCGNNTSGRGDKANRTQRMGAKLQDALLQRCGTKIGARKIMAGQQKRKTGTFPPKHPRSKLTLSIYRRSIGHFILWSAIKIYITAEPAKLKSSENERELLTCSNNICYI